MTIDTYIMGAVYLAVLVAVIIVALKRLKR